MKIVIAKDHPAFTPFQFVAQVVKTAPDNMAFIKVSAGSICSTDGHRLHIAATDGLDDLPAGLYEVLKHTKSEVVILRATQLDFPDVAQIVGVAAARSQHKLRLGYLPNYIYSPYCEIIRAMPAELCLNYSYAVEALTFGMTHFSVDGDGPITLAKGALSAYIMPAKMCKEA